MLRRPKIRKVPVVSKRKRVIHVKNSQKWNLVFLILAILTEIGTGQIYSVAGMCTLIALGFSIWGIWMARPMNRNRRRKARK